MGQQKVLRPIPAAHHGMSVEIQLLSPRWVKGAVALQSACFPPPFPPELLWQEVHLERHLEIFPEGQWVACCDGEVVGSASSMRVSAEAWSKPHTWDDLTGGLFLSGHDPLGSLLYGVDISVHPEFRGMGIARRLYEARFSLVRSLDLEAFVTICRLPDFSASGHSTVEAYAGFVASNVITDRTMTPLLKLGLTFTGVTLDCMEDEESGNSGARLEWRP